MILGEEDYKKIKEDTASEILIDVTSHEFEKMKVHFKKLLQQEVFQDIILNF